MGARSSGREAALQMLFALEVAAESASAGPSARVEQVIASFWRETPGDPEGRAFADQVVRGVAEHYAKLDEAIEAASQNWRLSRMTRVDRNVLRLGAWELLFSDEAPGAVVLDEAVELAKKFGTEDSGAFVNGVLDRVAEQVGRV
jgi:N utilization substance protein B